jgi:hypothetical protein
MPFLSPEQYARFLSKLPYAVSSNYGGYLVCGIIAGVIIYAVRSGRLRPELSAFFVVVLALSLIAVLPVSYPLYLSIRRPDPWYRIVFLPNTVLVLFGGWLAARYLTRPMALVVAAIAFCALLPGVEKTRRLWGDMLASADREGKFYLSNPEKILLSEQEAWWFIPGVHLL